jgi:predicted small secreted protein
MSVILESEKMLKKIMLVVALVMIALAFAGCQTVQGIGEDITWTGRAGAEVMNNIIYPPHKNQEPDIAYRDY